MSCIEAESASQYVLLICPSAQNNVDVEVVCFAVACSVTLAYCISVSIPNLLPSPLVERVGSLQGVISQLRPFLDSHGNHSLYTISYILKLILT